MHTHPPTPLDPPFPYIPPPQSPSFIENEERSMISKFVETIVGLLKDERANVYKEWKDVDWWLKNIKETISEHG